MFSTSNTLVSKAEELVTSLSNQQWFQPLTVSAYFPQIANPPIPQLPGQPTLETVTWTTPNAPAAFSVLPPSIQGLFPGAFQGLAPTLNFGSLPQPSYGSIPTSPSVNLNFNYPTPSVNLPNPPTLLSLDTVTFNPSDYAIPSFTGQVPTLSITQPNILAFVEPPAYVSTLLGDLTASLDSALTNGQDTGLDASTQQAMWDAAREREYRQQVETLDALNRDQETLGYALPSGVWNDNRIKIRTETAYTMGTLSRDIMVKQAEMRLENVMKSREMAVTLESHWIEYANNVAQRVFETAKFQTEAAIEIYNADVKIYEIRLEGFKATIQVYEAFIEGVKARVAVLNAEIEFEKTKAEINTALVEQYKTQLSAAELTLDVAKVQVEIIQTQANVEKTKVDVYSAQIQAFVSTVNAYTAEVEGYKANAEAQSAIENVYKTQVEAYAAQVNAAAQYTGALVEQYKAQVQGYEAQLEGYKASLQAMVEQARAASEYNQAATAEYTAQVQAIGTYNEVLVKTWEAILNEQMQIAQVQVKVSEANAQLAISARQTSIEAIKGAATVMAQLGAAALGAIHWSNSSQWSVSESLSSATSNSTSTVDEHIYSESA
jgi:predicted ester cyclase